MEKWELCRDRKKVYCTFDLIFKAATRFLDYISGHLDQMYVLQLLSDFP